MILLIAASESKVIGFPYLEVFISLHDSRETTFLNSVV